MVVRVLLYLLLAWATVFALQLMFGATSVGFAIVGVVMLLGVIAAVITLRRHRPTTD